MFDLEYSTKAPDGSRVPARLPTIVYVPRSHYLGGYDVHADGARVTSAPNARYLKLRRRPGSQDVALTVSPAQ
jgi:hypothetical protein